MDTVTASEFQKNFGRYQAQAQRGAVKVTSHGRDSVVLISAEDYKRLKSMDDRVSMRLADLPDTMVQAMDDGLNELENIEAAQIKRHGPW